MEEMKVSVKGKIMICPAQHTPKEIHWLSNLDMVMTPLHVPVLFFYKPNSSSGFFKSQVLKDALSKVLVPFYPMAGRLGCDENGRFQIICNAEGVVWVEAETTARIDDLGGFTPSSKLRELVPTVDYSRGTGSYPLFMVQLTTFKCGGVCLGIGGHHTLMDGTTTFHFVNSWSEMARGLSQIRVAPLIDRTLLRARVLPIPRFHHVEYDPSPSLITNVSNPKPSTTISVFKITQNQLNTLKAKFFKHGNRRKYSNFTILAAYMWRCASKARGLLDDQPTKLIMPINGRPRLHPPLKLHTVERVHGALQRMDDEYLRSALDCLEVMPDITVGRSEAETFPCPNLYINNWLRLPMHDADFGWGCPIYAGPANIIHEGNLYLLRTPTDDGSLSLIACLETSHMEQFEKHIYDGLMPIDKIMARY
ncbi:hypothetical protein V6N12_046678 [Hibiscus sabdariffa]|uniref:Shikimate O-hydroxycinnamoyltransferase-like n=1 Tax=Hibiscus sabdariffa TaxID=183260 RepID=A0ABR2AQH9_9ROSI